MRPHHVPPRMGALTLVATLAACGGGSDPPAPTPAPATISGVVADGPLQGATACYDLNDNAACDSGEPSATSDADGRYTFEVDPSAAGQHAVIAEVPATAIDQATGNAVGVAFVLKAPPSGLATAQSVFVSPLTTLVADVAASRGLTPAEATASVQSQLGLGASPLADYVAAADTQALTLARTLNTVRTEVAALAATAGLDAAATRALIDSVTSADLSTLAALVAASGAATPADIADEVAAKVLALRKLDATSLDEQAAIAQAFANPLPAGAPGPFVSLRRFAWTDANNHQLVAYVGDSSQIASDGSFAVSEMRVNKSAGSDVPFNRNVVYWVPSANAWRNCPASWELMKVWPATATSPQKSLFCGASTTLTSTAEYDVAGQKMADVVARIRASSRADTPGIDTDADGRPTKWGPDPAALGDAVFPEGARFSYREQTSEAGNTEHYTLTDKPRVIPASGAGTYRHAATFADLKRMSGNWVDANATVSNLNTVFLEDLPFDQADPALTDVKRYRAGFDPGSDKVRFFRCDVVAAANTSQGCEAIGDGVSAIATQDDSRVLRFTSGYPSELVVALQRRRLFVERDGVVFGGAVDLERSRFQHRPNMTAWNALRSALGMAEPPAPTAPVEPPDDVSLRRFTFTDAGNFSYRTLRGEAPASDGAQVLLEQWEFFQNGVRVPWRRDALYWTGSEWYACPDDPNGNPVAVGTFNDRTATSEYCKSYRDSDRRRTVVGLAGRSVQDVLRDIRWYPTKDGSYDYAGFGPNPEVTPEIVGKVFPAGATMSYASSMRENSPMTVFTSDANRLRVAPAPDTTAAFDTWPLATTLEDVIAKYPGDFGGGPLNGNVAQFVYGYDLAAPPAPEYTTRIEFRVAFDANGQKARFWRNNRAATTNFTTHYVKLLDTTYTVEQVGDARVLRFAAMPDEVAERMAGERMYIQRGGFVRYGAKDAVPAGRRALIQLNGVAAATLGQLLSMP